MSEMAVGGSLDPEHRGAPPASRGRWSERVARPGRQSAALLLLAGSLLKIFQHGTRIFDLRFFDDTEYLRRGLTMTWYALADHQGSPPYSLYYKAPGRVAC